MVGFIDDSGARWRADRQVLRPATALRVRRLSTDKTTPTKIFLAVLYVREGAAAEAADAFDVALFPGDFGWVAAVDVPAAALVAAGTAPLPPEVRDWLRLLFAPVWWWRRMGRSAGPRVFSAGELGLGSGIGPGGAA